MAWGSKSTKYADSLEERGEDAGRTGEEEKEEQHRQRGETGTRKPKTERKAEEENIGKKDCRRGRK